MKEFTLAGMAAHLMKIAADMPNANHVALETAAQIVTTEAKRAIGTYDYGWPQLAPSTLERKSANTPLLESGELRDSISYTVYDGYAEVGSDNMKAVWHELGTKNIPPRSFLVGAVMRKWPEVRKEVRAIFAAALAGDRDARFVEWGLHRIAHEVREIGRDFGNADENEKERR